VYNNASCVIGNLTQTHASITAPASSQLLTALGTNPGTYSWNIYATDRMSHTGATSACDDFIVDTALPSIS
jgi:hypothetical protein